MVLLKFSAARIGSYSTLMHSVSQQAFPWVYTNQSPVPNLTTATLGYCENMFIFKQQLSIWKSLCAKIEQNNNTPFPSADAILPSTVALHNKLKTAVDLLSSYLKHTYIPHKKLNPECVIYERLLLTLLLNCYSGYKCWKGAELLNGNKVRSYSEYKKKSSGLVGSFPEFLFDLASNLDDKWLQTVFGTDYGANLDRYEDEVCTAATEAFLSPLHEVAMPVLKQAKIHYKKAEKIVTHAKLNAVRENPGAKHVSVSTLLPGTKKGQKSCVLCCALCATAKGEAKHRSGSHYRIGHNVTTKCIQCNVHLCEISRFLYKGESRTCWDIFHSCTPKSSTEKKKQALDEIRPKQFPKRSLEVLTVSPLKPVPQTPELPSQSTAH